MIYIEFLAVERPQQVITDLYTVYLHDLGFTKDIHDLFKFIHHSFGAIT
jgi:hypothetical protein